MLTANRQREHIDEIKGKLKQLPPLYSAIKVNGKKLYEYAREGIKVSLPKRLVTIEEIELLDFNNETFKILLLKEEIDIKNKTFYLRSVWGAVHYL